MKMLLGFALLIVCGCTPSGPHPAVDAGGGDASDAGADAAPEAGGDSGSGGLTGPGVRGVLKDEADQPIGNATILACTASFCLFGASEADGHFAFPLDPPVDVAVKTLEDLTKTPRRGSVIVPVSVVAMSPVDLGAVHVPTLPPGAPLGPESLDPQTLKVGDGLELTVRRADLDPPIGVDLDDLAARLILPAHLHPLPALGAEQLIGVYALHPFTTTSKSPIGVRLPSTLPAGAEVSFRTISELDGHLSAPVHGKADGAFLTTDPSAGIDELTWLIVSR